MQSSPILPRLPQSTSARLPTCPVSVIVGAPRYFPCTVDWFLARCEVVEVRRGWRRRVLRVLERAGELTGAGLQARPARLRVWEGRQSWHNLYMFEQGRPR